ncbi:hypothetical protein NXW20_12255 [Bacteroides faecis]|uniref:hypothetical protein n=2 Tax=Bacteroides faecis TaxID=674529 RepID=UPI0012EAFB56|nr:hypothetical protein [Bacteroides faecis]MCS2196353.1 hypothetical protein [Bacteroides faecis]MCS2935793.1 hypothetical protein [Bacteroides faecis]MCS3067738.1 hypothetical protein [Bacteroides faecis]MCY6310005.1 hypothetical protein [Bacteroides faecis]
MCHPVCSVSVTPSKARLIGFYYKWKFQSIATVRSSRVSLRSTQLLLTVAMGLESWSSNGDLLDGSTERRLTLAEVELSNGLYGWLTDVGPHFRLIVLHAMPEVTTFFERCVIRFAPCLCDTKQISADWLWLQVETPVRCRCASSRWSGYGVAHTDMKNLSEITW